MGIIVSKNEKDEFDIVSTITDKSITGGFVSLNEAKNTLIIEATYDAIDNFIKINMQFPISYRVNDIPSNNRNIFNSWWTKEISEAEDPNFVYISKLNEISNENPLVKNICDAYIKMLED